VVITSRFPWAILDAGVHPDRMVQGPWGSGIILNFLLLGSILIHEVAHSLWALRMGLQVKSITLFMLGAISEISEPTGRDLREVPLALVGPLASFLLAFICFGALRVRVEDASSFPNQDLIFLLHWLGRANLVLGIFNLLPAFPLDGGRALRALLA
jgi:Zn-dependent protease